MAYFFFLLPLVLSSLVGIFSLPPTAFLNLDRPWSRMPPIIFPLMPPISHVYLYELLLYLFPVLFDLWGHVDVS